MSDSTTADPFGGLDKLLLQETKPAGVAATAGAASAAVRSSPKARILTNKQVSLQARNDASHESRKQASFEATLEERLQAVLEPQTLKANTFRWRQEELDRIRDIVYELETKYGHKIDKNDVVRIALNWLVLDFEEHHEASLLVRILTTK